MNIILISEERLKVVLTDSDLSDYGIRLEDIDYDNTETRRVFWTILDKAKLETGFDAAISRIFIQIYPNSRGGCEMYVSRIGKKRSEDTDQTDRSGSHISYRIEKTSQTVKNMEYLYRFGKFEHMLSACRVLNAMNFDGRSQAYSERTDGSGSWCLIIKGEAKWSLTLSEYGEAMKSRYDKWRIFEQYTEVCGDNAAEILGNL